MQALIEKEKDIDSNWTSFHKLYERYIYKGKPQEEQNRRTEESTPDIEPELFKK